MKQFASSAMHDNSSVMFYEEICEEVRKDRSVLVNWRRGGGLQKNLQRKIHEMTCTHCVTKKIVCDEDLYLMALSLLFW